MDREKVIKELTCCIYSELECECPEDCPYVDDDMSECQANVMRDALALLKEQEEQKHKWLVNIADNQLANAPDERYKEEWDYKKGVYDGLQMAWEILTEGR